MGVGFVRVRNLSKYQHYSNRNPPWVKLHVLILEDYEFCKLPDASKWHALGILILASKLENRIPNDPAWIQQRTQSSTRVNVADLISCGFLEQVASDVLAECSQNGGTETEGETERETEGEADSAALARTSSDPHEGNGAGKPTVPDRWVEVAELLVTSTNLNRKALFDWAWWDKLYAIYEDNDDLDFLKELRKADEYISRKKRKYKDFKSFVANWMSTSTGG